MNTSTLKIIRAIAWVAICIFSLTNCFFETQGIEAFIYGGGFEDLNENGFMDVGEKRLYDYSVTADLISPYQREPFYNNQKIAQANTYGGYELHVTAHIERDFDLDREIDHVYQISVPQIPRGYRLGTFQDVHVVNRENSEEHTQNLSCSAGPAYLKHIFVNIPFIPLEEGEIVESSAPTQTFTPTPTSTPTPTPTPTPTSTATPGPVDSCEIFLADKMSVFMLDIPPGANLNLSLYIEWPDQAELGPADPEIPDGWPGLEVPMPNDPEPFIYTAQLGNIPSSGDCSFTGYSGKIYCDFLNLPISMMDTTQVFHLLSNKCPNPIFTHDLLSIIGPDSSNAPAQGGPTATKNPTCSSGLPESSCNASGGTYQCSLYSCVCICP